MAVTRFGDWEQAKRRLTGNFAGRIAQALRQANEKNAAILVNAIKRGIVSQAPGGKSFVALADSTIEDKESAKALIDTGFLLNAITQKLMGDKAFVGILNGISNKDGTDLVDIGAVMEFGATIQQPNGTAVVIPPRPFLHPVLMNRVKEIKDNYLDSLGLLVK